MIAGVAGGLGRYFNVDPVIVRIAFAISIFFGGLGVIAYAALALFVPSAPDRGRRGRPAAGRALAGPGDRRRIALVVIALSWGVFDGPGWWGHGFFWSPFLFVALLVGGAVLIARRARGALALRRRPGHGADRLRGLHRALDRGRRRRLGGGDRPRGRSSPSS